MKRATMVVIVELRDDDPDLKRESAVLRKIRNDPNVVKAGLANIGSLRVSQET